MRHWRVGPLACLLGILVLVSVRAQTADDPTLVRMRKDVTFLASDECEGRGITTQGIDKAAKYIADAFQQAGLKPAPEAGSYYQPFTVSGASKLSQPNRLKLRGPLGQAIELKLGSDFQVMGLAGPGKIDAPLVFAGYGITAKDFGYDDYQDIDVAGKIVVLLRHTPRWDNSFALFDGPRREEHAGLEQKQALAQLHKAAAVIIVNDRSEDPAGDKLMPFNYITGVITPSSIPGLHVRRAVMDMVFQASLGQRLVDVEQAIDRDLKPRGALLAGWNAALDINVTRESIAVKNVVGVLEGAGPLAKETVVIGAHYDHLGYGGRGSRAKNPNAKEIHHGADDNASGTSTLMELARRFSQLKGRQGRRLVFIAFSAEESGLLGSRHYCNQEPLFPLDDTIAMVNLDMVGRLREDPATKKGKLIVEGTGTAKEFDKLIDGLNADFGFTLSKKPGGTGPSDHDSFYRKKIPVVFFWTGVHEEYHRPTDTADTINIVGMTQIAGLAEKTIKHLSTVPDRPEYVQVASTFSPGAGKGPRLGIVPNYDSAKEGVLVGGVSEDGPAAKGGVKAGDLIVEMAGKQVTNLQTYMVIMSQHRPGQVLEVGVLRDGKKLSLKVVPK